MRSPKLGQEVIQVMPLPMVQFRKDVRLGLYGDLSKILRFDGLERLDDPLHVWPHTFEHQVFEFCGSGQVKRKGRGAV